MRTLNATFRNLKLLKTFPLNIEIIITNNFCYRLYLKGCANLILGNIVILMLEKLKPNVLGSGLESEKVSGEGRI